MRSILFAAGASSIAAMLLAWVASRFGFIAPRWLMLSLAGLSFGCAIAYTFVR